MVTVKMQELLYEASGSRSFFRSWEARRLLVRIGCALFACRRSAHVSLSVIGGSAG